MVHIEFLFFILLLVNYLADFILVLYFLHLFRLGNCFSDYSLIQLLLVVLDNLIDGVDFHGSFEGRPAQFLISVGETKLLELVMAPTVDLLVDSRDGGCMIRANGNQFHIDLLLDVQRELLGDEIALLGLFMLMVNVLIGAI